jgi:uncharacterized protein
VSQSLNGSLKVQRMNRKSYRKQSTRFQAGDFCELEEIVVCGECEEKCGMVIETVETNIAAIDRVTPMRCPADRQVMRQNWYDLTFLHWAVPVEQLRPLIPAELEIDTYQGRAYVGLVPFTMRGVSPMWSPPMRPLSDFHETNVRTYVHLHGDAPGVWFFSLDAANTVAVRIARGVWRLPYHYARMSLSREETQAGANDSSSNRGGLTVTYHSERLWPPPLPANCHVTCQPDGAVNPAEVGTQEHFLVERYLLYAYRNRRLYRGQVHHTPYPLQTARLLHLEESLTSAAGITLPDEPPLVHYAAALQVRIFPLKRVE